MHSPFFINHVQEQECMTYFLFWISFHSSGNFNFDQYVNTTRQHHASWSRKFVKLIWNCNGSNSSSRVRVSPHTRLRSSFLQTHKIGNNGIIVYFIYPYIYCNVFFIASHDVSSCDLNISRYKMSISQCCRFHWCSSFIRAQLKQSWQYWYSSIAKSLWKTLLKELPSLMNRDQVTANVPTHLLRPLWDTPPNYRNMRR